MTTIEKLLLILSFSLSTTIANANEMLVAYGDYDVAPFVLMQENKLVGGILKDIGDEVAAGMQLNAEYLMIPRKRMSDMVLAGSAHMRIVFNPNWVEKPEQYHWSPVLFEDTDILVVKTSDLQKYTGISDLNSAHIGTIMGHIYPEFEDYFANNSMVRDNSINMDTNLVRLEKGRVNAIITTQMAFDYCLSTYKGKGMFSKTGILNNANSLSIMVSPNAPWSKEMLDSVIKNLKSSGRMDAILARYR